MLDSKSKDAFNKISQELFDKSYIRYFALSITNIANNQVSFISSHPAFTIEMFDEKFPFMAPFLEDGYYMLDQIFKERPDRYKQHQLGNVLFYIKRIGGDIYCYTFASDVNGPPLINFYLNNLSFLERFTMYFQEQGKEIIAQMKINTIAIPHRTHPEFYKSILHEQIKEEPVIIQRYYNPKSESWITLTDRERETLLHAVIHGKTAVKTGELLHISPKTVESYLESLRRKLGASTKGELLERAIDIGLVRLQYFF